MGNSLQDQLLSAGLVDKKRLKKAKAEQRKQARGRNKGGQEDPQQEDREKRQQVLEQRRQLDRELNRKRQESNRRKALVSEIEDLIDSQRADCPANLGQDLECLIDAGVPQTNGCLARK